MTPAFRVMFDPRTRVYKVVNRAGYSAWSRKTQAGAQKVAGRFNAKNRA